MSNIVSEAVNKYGTGRESLIPVLQYVVNKDKWLKEEVMEDIASQFEMSPAEVYGVASFYSFLDTEPRGKYVIRLCRTISCEMEGKEAVANAVKNLLRVENGETTPDGLFTLLETNCIGWCHKGPAMLINDEAYTELTADKTVEILQSFISKENQ